MKHRYNLLLFLLAMAWTLSAQDEHFSNYRFAPLAFNPVNTGNFLGNLRAGCNARSQYSSFFSNPYQSVVAYLDAPFEVPFRKSDWVGAGLQLFHDQAGDLGYENNMLQLSGSYFFSYAPKYRKVLGIGISYLAFNRKFANPSRAIFSDAGGNDLNLLQSINSNGSDFSIGISHRNIFDNESYLKVDAAINNLNGKSFKGIKQENALQKRWNASARYGFTLPNDKTLVEASVFYSQISKFTNVSVQCIANHDLSVGKKGESGVTFGLGYRLGDAIQFITGGQYKSWNLSFTWDMTVSSARAYNNYDGAFELGLYKIFIIHRKPKLVPILFCPNF